MTGGGEAKRDLVSPKEFATDKGDESCWGNGEGVLSLSGAKRARAEGWLAAVGEMREGVCSRKGPRGPEG